MTVYIGQTRSRALISRLQSMGFGEMCTPSDGPPRRLPWALDNGAFHAWKHGESFDHARYEAAVERAGTTRPGPDFTVAPDLVAAGHSSLAFSVDALPVARRAGVAVYLAVQDGMPAQEVAAVLKGRVFDGLFVGGTLGWKVATGAAWVQLAHRHRVPCHIGRVGTPKRVRWARRIGADSIDSALPLWSEANLQRFLTGWDDRQAELPGVSL